MAGPRLILVRWLLFLLDLLSLLFVSLLEVLRLLLVALLYLLSPGVICILLSQTLMFLFLFLLEPLMFLFVFGVELFLLLLVLLIALGVPRVGRREPLVRRKLVGMRWTARIRRTIGIRFAIGGRLVAPSRFSGRDGVAIAECSGPRSRRYRRFAMIFGGAQLAVGAGFIKMLILRPNRPDMALSPRGFFVVARPPVNATMAPVIADAVYRRIVVYDRRVVGVMDFRDIDVVHRAVVVKAVVLPAAAFITVAEIAEAIIYAAVKTNPWAPITLMENKGSSAPAPIGRRPEKTGFRSQHPGAGYPKIIIPIPGPVAGSPYISFLGTDGLLIDGQQRRRIADGNADADLSVR